MAAVVAEEGDAVSNPVDDAEKARWFVQEVVSLAGLTWPVPQGVTVLIEARRKQGYSAYGAMVDLRKFLDVNEMEL